MIQNPIGNNKYCKLYLPFQTSVTEEISKGKSETHTVTNYGSVGITTVSGRKCASFNGSNQYLTIPTSADFDLADKEFTIAFWIYINSTPTDSKTFLRKSDLSSDHSFWIQTQGTGKIAALIGAGGSGFFLTTGSNAFLGGAWYHMAFVRRGNVMFFFLDGELQDSDTQSVTIPTSTQNLVIGSLTTDSSKFAGYMSEIAIHKGIARFTRNFTPPNRMM